MNENDKKYAIADILSRPNAMNGRYESGGFKLGYWYKDFTVEGPNVIRARADLSDQLIADARSSGKDVDNKSVLKNIAREANSRIDKKIWVNRVIVFTVIIFVIAILIVVSK